ncbi:MAG: RNA-binding protein [Sandaracinaceae bacterium]|nr:RNA-binding protein [Sandaracinaceae bacterium]
MSRGTLTQGKRDRESRKAQKKRDKEEKRRERRERGPQEIPVVTAEDVVGRLPTVAEAMIAMETRSTRAAAPVPARLFVGHLSLETSSASLRDAFTPYGEVLDAAVIRDRNTGQSRGFGFVTMADRKDAPKAIEALDRSVLDGSTIAVNVATESQSSRPRW